jgi:aryl-alcohol dehydrogenase-like predicted oxidoreductase
LVSSGTLARDELILCTKGGYVPFDDAVPPDPSRYVVDTTIDAGLATYEDLVAGCHCLSPAYLDHTLRASVKNLRVQAIDVYYLHNPEEQLDEVDRETFLQRLDAAFALLEHHASAGLIRWYGIATWKGLRVHPKAKGYLSLEELIGIAQHVGGATHHFRIIQLPYNLAMPEAFAFQNQMVNGEPCSVLEASRHYGLSVMASASLLQSRLHRLPPALASRIPGTRSSAQRAIQFVRSTPGVTAALVGMKSRAHVEENLSLAKQPVLGIERLNHFFDRRQMRQAA